jgi:hypothetical protein
MPRLPPQNKPPREDRQRGQEMAELKRQNRILRRQVARLTKDNEKLLAMPEPEPDTVPDSEAPPIFDHCDICQSMKVKDVRLPTGTLRTCLDCGARKKI